MVSREEVHFSSTAPTCTVPLSYLHVQCTSIIPTYFASSSSFEPCCFALLLDVAPAGYVVAAFAKKCNHYQSNDSIIAVNDNCCIMYTMSTHGFDSCTFSYNQLTFLQ